MTHIFMSKSFQLEHCVWFNGQEKIFWPFGPLMRTSTCYFDKNGFKFVQFFLVAGIQIPTAF